MDSIKDIFERMELQQVCSFLLTGLENDDSRNATYENRLREGSKSSYKRLESICQNEDEFDKAVTDLAEAFVAYESVYVEVGMKCGARLMNQLLHTNDVGTPI